MRRLLLTVLFILALSLAGRAQSTVPIRICEVDGNPCVSQPSRFNLPNGTLTRSGQVVTYIPAGGAGTVTSVSVASANGFAGSSSSGATPVLTLSTTVTGLLKGNGTAISAASAGTDYVAPGGALGTPSSGTLTNTTGYVFANLASKPTTLSGYGITDGVSGSGTPNSLPKWLTSTTLGDSLITEVGSVVTIGSTGAGGFQVDMDNRKVFAYGDNINSDGAVYLATNELRSEGQLAGLRGGTGVANAGKTITLGGNLTTSGAFATTITVTGATGVTLPTTGTLATLAGSEALTNKTINGNTFTAGTYTLTGTAAKTLNFTDNVTLSSDGTGTRTLNIGAGGTLATGAFAAAGANTALANLASVAINTDLLPASTQGLGNASFPFLAAFTGTTAQYFKTSQSAGLISLEALGSAGAIGLTVIPKSANFTVQWSGNSQDTVTINSGGTLSAGTSSQSGNPRWQLLANNTQGLRLGSDFAIAWNSAVNLSSGSLDTGFSRIAAGLLGVGTGATGSFAGSLKLTGITQAAGGLFSISSGTNQRAGDATLVGGTVTVSNTTVTANTKIMLTRHTSGGTIGTATTYSVSAGTAFTITSDNILDTSVFTYVLIEVP